MGQKPLSAERVTPPSAGEKGLGETLPPGQQLAAADKWPIVGERRPRQDDAPWTVCVAGRVAEPCVWTLPLLASLPQVEAAVDIHCVTRWSKLGMRFRGVPLAALLDAARPAADARYVSFVARSDRSHSTSLPLAGALGLGVLIALEAQGQPLAVEHGGPVRTVTPGRYFYKSLKWLERIELLAEDRLGYWEAETGYHNQADPWLEQRYLAATLSRAETRDVLAARDFRGRDLRSLAAADAKLDGLQAAEALLRNADFRRASLVEADFTGANLSNAQLAGANLQRARFVGADCEGADFSAADLRGADFRGASLFGATFCEVVPQGDWANAARFDAGTRLDAAAVEQLTPRQADCVRFLLAGR